MGHNEACPAHTDHEIVNYADWAKDTAKLVNVTENVTR